MTDREDNLTNDRLIREEQRHVDRLYARLDELRAEKEDQLARVRREGPSGSFQNISERDSFAALYEDRLAQLYAVEDRLAFGSLTLEGHAPGTDDRYIGRMGMTDAESQRILVDWRAPEAGTFYQATAFEPQGVARRRHLMLRGRTLVGLEDEVLSETFHGPTAGSGGDGALLAGLNAKRTGHMHDIVATIQKEQDEIIRRPLSGLTLVQGGPGTGKTAVALHRAAYLLYTHRERLSRSGVLLVGPSTAFLDYIERVLPSLGETGVVMKSVGELYPGVSTTIEDEPDSAEIKGRAVWKSILKRAVRQRQRTFPGPRPINVEGFQSTITPRMVKQAQEKARATRQPYNQAREVFAKTLMGLITEHVTEQVQASAPGSSADRSYVKDDVAASADVRVALNLAWMPIDPPRLLDELLSKPEQLVDAASELSSAEITALLRARARLTSGMTAEQRRRAWTVSDVPLLDELADLLGPVDVPHALRDRADAEQDARDTDNAERTLQNVDSMLTNVGVNGILTVDDVKTSLSVRAARVNAATAADTDRSWAYGHVIVDEAQELTHMQWSTIFKRVPVKSLTVVGDIAQASTPGAARSWTGALSPFVEDRFEELQLTINYRTPRQISDAAVEVARVLGTDLDAPRAIREGAGPQLTMIEGESWREGLVGVVGEEVRRAEGGLVAAIVPPGALAASRAALQTFPEVRVLDAHEAKGLEFDVVVLMDPEAVLRGAGGRVGSLYVAMTRSTQRLHVLGVDDLSADLRTILESHDHDDISEKGH